jgi:cytochrome c
MHTRFAIGILVAAATGALLGSGLRAQQSTTTTTTTSTTSTTTTTSDAMMLSSGVFTADQAKRGQGIYGEACAKCHLDDLSGGTSPPLVGEEFLKGWTGKTVGAFFDELRMTMPFDSPGGLKAEQYADIVAYIFSANKYPAGSQELAHEVAPLQKIQIDKN